MIDKSATSVKNIGGQDINPRRIIQHGQKQEEQEKETQE
mgnify:CR=1 FL=1